MTTSLANGEAASDQDVVDPASATSDKSFAAPSLAVVEPTSVGDTPEAIQERLKGAMSAVRSKLLENLNDEADEYESGEARHADLLEMGWKSALDLLANKSILRRMLTKINLIPAKDDVGLMGQIAKLQLGDWIKLKDGETVWRAPRRRDERLGRFYRIFLADQEKWAPGKIKDTILATKGKSGGVLAKPKKTKVTDEEVKKSRELARKAAPLTKLKDTSRKWGKAGDYVLVLARVESHGLDICEVVKGQATLTQSLSDSYAMEAALTVPSDEA